MARPSGGYFTQDGERVPSVTTITGRLRSTDALMAWQAREFRAGRDPDDAKTKAATAGTLAHQNAYALTHGQPIVWPGDCPSDVLDKAMRAFGAFQRWADQTRLTVEKAEISLVSEQYRYGGTFDALVVQGQRAMAEYKTSAKTYPDHLAQVAAYAHLWLEHFPEQPIDGGFHVLRFDRDTGDFHASHYPELDDAWEMFLLQRHAYDLEKRLAKRCQ